ncbi:MAG: alpha/beta hydrolase [Candidatus Hodarchaeales archaeon]
MNLNVNELRNQYKDAHLLVNTSDDKILFMRRWNPTSSDIRDIAILLFHGITAHSGSYSIIAEPLSAAGYTVFGLDLRGHGLSDGKRGDYPGITRLLSDLCESIAMLKREFTDIVIFGHSLGVLTSLLAVANCNEDLKGLILFSGARKLKEGAYPEIPLLTKIKVVLSSLLMPSRPVIKYYREGIQGLDDPLCNFKYTLRFMKTLNIRKLKVPESINYPVLIGVGDQDELFDVAECKNLFNELPAENKEFLVVKGASHANFPAGSFDKVVEWLEMNVT